eukprot:Nk52_evm1s2380 gene=Nk52_evmTU1s2380
MELKYGLGQSPELPLIPATCKRPGKKVALKDARKRKRIRIEESPMSDCDEISELVNDSQWTFNHVDHNINTAESSAGEFAKELVSTPTLNGSAS